MSLKSVVSFGFLLLSAIGFSLIMLYARMFEKDSLSDLIKFQSTSVFVVFILQMGLRAGGRMHYHLGDKRIVEDVLSFLNLRLWKYVIPFTIIAPLIDEKLFIMFCTVQAVMSFNQGIFIAKMDYFRASVSSTLVFLNIVSCCLSVIYIQDKLIMRAVVEGSSLLLLLAQARYSSDVYSSNFKNVIRVVKKYWGLQLGSFLVYYCNYLFAQSVLVIGKVDKGILAAYSDGSIVCGLILLLLGKILVIQEANVIKEEKQFVFAFNYVLFAIGFSILFGFVTNYLFGYKTVFALSISLFILGRLSFAFCSQFASKQGRKHIYIVAIPSLVFLIFNTYLFKNNEYADVMLLFSTPVISTMLFLALDKSKFYGELFVKNKA